MPSIPSLAGEILFKSTESADGERDKKIEQLERQSSQTDTVASPFVEFLKSSAEMKNCKFTGLNHFSVFYNASLACESGITINLIINNVLKHICVCSFGVH